MGLLKNVEINRDKNTGNPRGFAFLSLEDHDSVDQAVLQKYHEIAGHKIETKKALSKEEMVQAHDRQANRRGGRDGGFSSGGSYDRRGVSPCRLFFPQARKISKRAMPLWKKKLWESWPPYSTLVYT